MIAVRENRRARKQQPLPTTSCGAAPTPMGWVAVSFAGQQIARVSIGNRSRRDALAAVSAGSAAQNETLTHEQEHLLERLADTVSGGPGEDFRDVVLDLSHLGPFARRVAERCRRIPRGSTMSYAELAAACGSPGAARAVGNVMRTNRFPLVVPCHRVVGSDGSLGGFSAPTGIELKRQLLQLEGALPK